MYWVDSEILRPAPQTPLWVLDCGLEWSQSSDIRPTLEFLRIQSNVCNVFEFTGFSNFGEYNMESYLARQSFV